MSDLSKNTVYLLGEAVERSVENQYPLNFAVVAFFTIGGPGVSWSFVNDPGFPNGRPLLPEELESHFSEVSAMLINLEAGADEGGNIQNAYSAEWFGNLGRLLGSADVCKVLGLPKNQIIKRQLPPGGWPEIES